MELFPCSTGSLKILFVLKENLYWKFLAELILSVGFLAGKSIYFFVKRLNKYTTWKENIKMQE